MVARYSFSLVKFFTVTIFIFSPAVILPAFAQDWPETLANRQVEFELDQQDAQTPEEPETQEVIRGQVNQTNGGEAPTVSRVLQRDIINPFDTDQVEATPLMQMLPEDITVPELPDLEIQQQINLDEFRNYLNTLVEDPAQQVKNALSKNDIKKELNKIVITSLMTSPEAYVVINNKRFKVGDRFAMPVNMPRRAANMQAIIEQQMPDEDTLPADIYQEFEAIKQEALEKYRSIEAKRQSEANGDTHNISVIINDIKHRKIVVSVDGDEYIIPIKVAL